MADTVRMKHITRKNDWKMFFYDGVEHVKGGVIELSVDDKTRIRRAWLMGFRLTEDGQHISANRYNDIVAQARVDSSEEQTSEQKSSRRGRQPRNNNRVRESEPHSSGDTDSGGAPGSVSGGTGNEEGSEAEVTGSGE